MKVNLDTASFLYKRFLKSTVEFTFPKLER